MTDEPHFPQSRTPFGMRHQARRCLLQAIYAWQQNDGATPASQILAEFLRRTKVGDEAYFREVFPAAVAGMPVVRDLCAPSLDRPWDQVDPVERAILILAVHEIRTRPEVPVRVVLNEAIELAKEFGAPESHRFVNAVLERVRHNLSAAAPAV
jgi:N utilization substance protein B